MSISSIGNVAKILPDNNCKGSQRRISVDTIRDHHHIVDDRFSLSPPSLLQAGLRSQGLASTLGRVNDTCVLVGCQGDGIPTACAAHAGTAVRCILRHLWAKAESVCRVLEFAVVGVEFCRAMAPRV